MECRKLPKFEAIIDGNMSKAFKIVANVRASNNFTIRDWPGQSLFVQESLETFNDYKQIVINESRRLGRDVSEPHRDDEKLFKQRYLINGFDEPSSEVIKSEIRERVFKLSDLDVITEALTVLGESGELNYNILTRAYTQIMYYLDRIRQVSSVDIFGNYPRTFEIMFRTNLDSVIFVLQNTNSSKIVPIIGITGAYGLNTFLYLYYNGLYPVGIGYSTLIAHGQQFGSLIEQYEHDEFHASREERYSETLEKIYPKIFDEYDNIGQDRAKAFIFLIFWHYHEESFIFPEQLTAEDVFFDATHCDAWELFDNTPRYSSETLGFDLGPRVDGKRDCHALSREEGWQYDPRDLAEYSSDNFFESELDRIWSARRNFYANGLVIKYLDTALNLARKDFFDYFNVTAEEISPKLALSSQVQFRSNPVPVSPRSSPLASPKRAAYPPVPSPTRAAYSPVPSPRGSASPSLSPRGY
jgi:hypothetical protein